MTYSGFDSVPFCSYFLDAEITDSADVNWEKSGTLNTARKRYGCLLSGKPVHCVGTTLVFDVIPRTECKQQQWQGSHCNIRKAKVIALGYHYSVSTFPRILLPRITYLSKLVQYTCSSASPAGTCHGLTDARWTSFSFTWEKEEINTWGVVY